MPMLAWSLYQEEVAAFFRTLGLDSQTNIELTGARTSHLVDVVVRGKYVGFDILWIVECKAWSKPVPKEKVFALRTIVDDIGADRGFMMAEEGYQSGALEGSRLTNVVLTSIADLQETLAYDLGMAKLQTLHKRVKRCSKRYWAIGKYDRIDHGLRPDTLTFGFSGATLSQAIEQTLLQVLAHGFPVVYNEMFASMAAYSDWHSPAGREHSIVFETPGMLFDYFDAELSKYEGLLDAAEASLKSTSGMNPK